MVEITSEIITAKKLARLPLVMRNTKKTKAEAMSPDRMLTVTGVPTLENRPVRTNP